jgi:hypothetical protein
MKKVILLLFISGMLHYSCSSSSSDVPNTNEPQNPNENPGTNQNNNQDWSIPISEVLDGGPGKDGIPALENPAFVQAELITYVQEDDLVIGFKNGDDIRAYPHAILDWHEIINDNIGDVSVAVTYCPLTGTGIGWDRRLSGSETTFGVSGLLYNTNLIPYDRASNSNWSQILNESVNGSLVGEKANLIYLFETDFKTWKTMYPTTKAVSVITGFNRTYGITPYGDYATNNNFFLFPVDKDPRLPLKQRVMAIVDGTDAKVYTFDTFSSENIINDSFKGTNYMVVGNENFIVAFALKGDFETLNFQYAFDGSEVLMTDNENNSWNVFGEAISGPRVGQKLANSPSFMAYWFSIPAFYETEIYSN